MKIAIPIQEDKGEESLISHHFGHVKSIAIYDSESKKLKIKPIKEIDGCSPISALEGEDIGIIYCFGIGMRAIQLCKEQEIQIKTGEFKTVKEVIENLDNLEDLKEGCGH